MGSGYVAAPLPAAEGRGGLAVDLESILCKRGSHECANGSESLKMNYRLPWNVLRDRRHLPLGGHSHHPGPLHYRLVRRVRRDDTLLVALQRIDPGSSDGILRKTVPRRPAVSAKTRNPGESFTQGIMRPGAEQR